MNIKNISKVLTENVRVLEDDNKLMRIINSLMCLLILSMPFASLIEVEGFKITVYFSDIVLPIALCCFLVFDKKLVSKIVNKPHMVAFVLLIVWCIISLIGSYKNVNIHHSSVEERVMKY